MHSRIAVIRRMAAVVVAVGAVLAVTSATGAGSAAAEQGSRPVRVSGAGHTIVEGGTGGDAPMPVKTVQAFHASKAGGHFECLALAPQQPTGPGSGEFTANVMYVTGPVTEVSAHGGQAVLRGTATVTGIGAGKNQPYTLTVREGGPGATVVLEVSGLTFREILLDGQITVD